MRPGSPSPFLLASLVLLAACGKEGESADANSVAAVGPSPTVDIAEGEVHVPAEDDGPSDARITALDAATGRDVDIPYAPFAIATSGPRKDAEKDKEDADKVKPAARRADPIEETLPTVGD